LRPHRRLCMGLSIVQMGQGRYFLVSSRCLQACSGQCQSQKLPRWNHVHFSGCNSAMMMMVATKNEGGPLGAQNRPHWKVLSLRGPDKLFLA
jgi:hypothetical protein